MSTDEGRAFLVHLEVEALQRVRCELADQRAEVSGAVVDILVDDKMAKWARQLAAMLEEAA